MAKEYIEKEALLNDLKEAYNNLYKMLGLHYVSESDMPYAELGIFKQIMMWIKEWSPANVVEVTRCKDCKWYIEEDFDGEILCGCDCCSGLNDVDPYGFCSYGERKE